MRPLYFLLVSSFLLSFCQKSAVPRKVDSQNSSEITEANSEKSETNSKKSTMDSESECKEKIPNGSWDEKTKVCSENLTLVTAEAECKAKGDTWTWDNTGKKCSENLTLVMSEAACQAKGEGWAYTDGNCVQNVPLVTNVEQCTAKGAGWVWDGNACKQNPLEITSKQQCESKDQTQWKWVPSKAEDPNVGSCMELNSYAQLERACGASGAFWDGSACKAIKDLDEATCATKYGDQKSDHWLSYPSFSRCFATKEEKECLAQNNVTPALGPLFQYSWGNGTQVGANARSADSCFRGFCAVKEAHIGWEGKNPVCKNMYQATDPTKRHNYIGALALGSVAACAVFGPFLIPVLNVVTEGRLQCWGKVDFFKGTSDSKLSSLPSSGAEASKGVVDLSTVTLTPIITGLAVGYFHACAIINHKLYCWGALRQIAGTDSWNAGGDSNLTAIPSEVKFPISIKYVRKVVANTYASHDSGRRVMCSVVVDSYSQKGKLFCWGHSEHALQSGTGLASAGNWDYWPRAVQNLPEDGDVLDVSLSAFHACAVVEVSEIGGAKSSSVWCWGHNASGRANNTSFGTGSIKASEVAGTKGATKVSVGDEHSCAVINGKISCWGKFPLTSDGTSPNPTAGTGISTTLFSSETGAVFSKVLTGRAISCSIHNDSSKGILRCWGSNGEGQVGQGALNANVAAGKLKNLNNVSTAVTSANFSMCAVEDKGSDVDEELYCWGSNDTGILGNTTFNSVGAATVADSLEPILVSKYVTP